MLKLGAPHRSPRARSGFTLIELLVVLAIIALLLTIGLPRYFRSVDKSREAVLKHDLVALREAIDQLYADKGRYPETLDELVDLRYLRSVPVDPLTESASTWVTVPPPEPQPSAKGGSVSASAGPTRGIYDVRSGAAGVALDGTNYDAW